jgi:hypothetical protein
MKALTQFRFFCTKLHVLNILVFFDSGSYPWKAASTEAYVFVVLDLLINKYRPVKFLEKQTMT